MVASRRRLHDAHDALFLHFSLLLFEVGKGGEGQRDEGEGVGEHDANLAPSIF